MRILTFCIILAISFAKSCADSCSTKGTQAQIDNCNRECTNISIIIGAVVGGFFGILFLIVGFGLLYSYCGKKYSEKQDLATYKSAQQISRVVYDNRTEQEFEYQKQRFLSIDWYFYYYYTDSENRYEKRYHFEAFRQSRMFYRLVGEATDNQGRWKLQGYYMNTAEGIRLAMKNQRVNYHDPKNTVFYVGIIDDNKNYSGNWYIEKTQDYPGSKGRWKMEPRIRPPIVETQLTYQN